MSLEKLLSILQTRSLYFGRLRLFRDPYEGSAPIGWQGGITDLSQIPDSLSDWTEIPLAVADGKYLKDETIRDEIYVSCWHSNQFESAAMWSLYSNESGIAIKTTSDQLGHALRDCRHEVQFAAVEYAEILPGFMSGSPWTIKRTNFQHEREVRAWIRDPICQECGFHIPVDIESLIEQIYVNPMSELWIADVVRDVVAKYGFAKTVQRSDLYTLKR